MASCLRNCEECEYKETCNESLTIEAIEKRAANFRRDFAKMFDGSKGKETDKSIDLKKYLVGNKGV